MFEFGHTLGVFQALVVKNKAPKTTATPSMQKSE